MSNWQASLKRAGKHVLSSLISRKRLRASWKSESVALQQEKLVTQQLLDPMEVPPFRAFKEIMEFVAASQAGAPRSFLDIGCGVGHYAELLARYFPGRFHYTGADYSARMVARAKGLWPHSTFVVDDIFDSRLDLRSYDILFASALVDVIDDFWKILHVLFSGASRTLVLHRQRITEKSSYSEITNGYRGQKTFATYLNRAELEESLATHGLRLTREFVVEGAGRSFVIEKVP